MKRLLSLIALVVTICGTMTAQNASTDRIWYTSADGAIIELYIDLYDFGVSTFGARIMSFSEYDEERGMYYFQFNGPVTKIGAGAFRGITELTSIIIPDGVTIIENEEKSHKAEYIQVFGVVDVMVVRHTTGIQNSEFPSQSELVHMYPNGRVELMNIDSIYLKNMHALIVILAYQS